MRDTSDMRDVNESAESKYILLEPAATSREILVFQLESCVCAVNAARLYDMIQAPELNQLLRPSVN